MRAAPLFIAATAVLFVSPAYTQAKPPQTNSPQCSPLTDQTLHCPRFGFTYKVPFGWVDRTAVMNADAQSSRDANSDQAQNSPANKSAQAPPSSAGSETILAVFERPPGAPGDTINSAVVIAAEPMANYGIKTAADYFGAISELAQKRGFKAVSDPYLFSVGTKQLVRGDFTKQRGNLTMYQTSLAMVETRYIVSFTFLVGSEDEANDLISRLNFGANVHRNSLPSK